MTKFNYNTAIISDLHLSDAEPVHPKKPYWKNFKQAKHFFDDSFEKFLNNLEQESQLPVELILNGDIFDYDSVMSLPEDEMYEELTHLEKKIGVDAHEDKSLFKTRVILDQHYQFVDALKKFIKNGNRVVFIVGNHDIELYWPSTQREIENRLIESDEDLERLVFCEWYYISERDTLIEHGHQYDPYCLCIDPVNPLIRKKKEYKIRLPFGNLANRYIMNNFGLKNPHHDESFVKTGLEFVQFFFKYEVKVQPFLVFHWLIGALKTMRRSFEEAFTPASKDPLTHEQKIKDIARKANSAPAQAMALLELHAHPAVHNPFKIIREMWLDRFFLMLILIAMSWQIFTTHSLFTSVSLWWFTVPMFLSIPILAYYAQGIKSEVHQNLNAGQQKVAIAAQIVDVKRVVHGHTHIPLDKHIEDVHFLNPGSWSPYFEEIECVKNRQDKRYVWIEEQGEQRHATLKMWEKA
ncbi:MAG: metallophosphoesterase [Bacteriovoracaceae bacterium]|nr:metallophosphoesterase [Bacteriovoracaceae bacterium]